MPVTVCLSGLKEHLAQLSNTYLIKMCASETDPRVLMRIFSYRGSECNLLLIFVSVRLWQSSSLGLGRMCKPYPGLTVPEYAQSGSLDAGYPRFS